MKAMTVVAAVATIMGSSPALAAGEAAAPTVLLDRSDLEELRHGRNGAAELVTQCNADLDYVPKPVADFAPDPHYDLKGVNGSANNGKQLAADSRAAYHAAICHLTTGDARFAQTAQRIIDAWAGTLKKVSTAQGKAGINFNVPYLIAAASWTRQANAWDGARFSRFLNATVLPNSASDNPNNHGKWGVFMEAAAATYLDDAALLERARSRWGEIMLGASNSEGVLIREVERSGTSNWRGGPDKGSKGIAYTHYFLLPASMAAKIFADRGQPVWATPGGVRLGAAFAKAAAWSLRPETFPHYASNRGRLIDVPSATYFPLLLRYYPSCDAAAAIRTGAVAHGHFLLSTLFASSVPQHARSACPPPRTNRAERPVDPVPTSPRSEP